MPAPASRIRTSCSKCPNRCGTNCAAAAGAAAARSKADYDDDDDVGAVANDVLAEIAAHQCRRPADRQC